ncbi:MAG: hypothetical protein IKP77_02185 [Acholeplasmatales bacterium]|nr:hypothetical protein [Acholeplasmatales bacterium]
METNNTNNMPIWLIILIIAGSVLALLAVTFSFIITKKKNSTPKIKIDDEFITTLIMYLGTLTNIKSVGVDNGRLKIEVNDLDVADLKAIQTMTTSGVFVTGNNIKLLFKYDSETIKKAIENRLK